MGLAYDIKPFDNIVIDGNNFIHRYRQDVEKMQTNMTAAEHFDHIEKIVKLLSKHFPKKNLYFVFKDPETEKQAKDIINIMSAKNVKHAHKLFFNNLAKKYTNVRFIVAYGDAKYRDDYAAIWLADTLPDDTILLSRDRYRDANNMKGNKLVFLTYGKRASSINKIINKPFNYVSHGAAKAALVGYTFGDTFGLSKSGFYHKRGHKQSDASQLVYVF